MIKRWYAAGMLNAERSFRRLKGYRQIPTFVAALASHLEAVTLGLPRFDGQGWWLVRLPAR
jgi:hypothetical protein